ncbi:MAG: RibD family protein [Alphaproteobacteria bacterium]
MPYPAESSIALIAGAPAERPFVVGQIGQSLDGRIATATGQSHYINGPAALDHLHRLRAAVDAVVVGVSTILHDDPQLTVRRCNGRQPQRVVIDPRGRMPQGARCLHDGGPAPIRVTAPERAGDANALGLPADPVTGLIAPAAVVEALFARGYRRLLVEGGATTLSAFVAAHAVDRLHILLAPILIGSGMPGLTLPPIDGLTEALRPAIDVVSLDGGDILFDCALASRWAQA